MVSGLANRSSNLLTPDEVSATQTLTSLLALPIQENFEASKRAPCSLSRGSKATEPPGDQAGIEVVTAADTVADVEFDRFAPVELRRALRARHGDEDDKSSDRECRCGNRKSSRFHADPLSTVGARSSTFWHTQRMPQSLRARHCTGGRNPLNDGAKWRA